MKKNRYLYVCAQSLSHIGLSVAPWTVAARLLCPWNFPGKNTGVDYHSLFQDMCIDRAKLLCCTPETYTTL